MGDSSNQQLHLTVSTMAYGGRGIARHEGKVYFVRDAIPGDEVIARIISDSGRYADAQIESIVRPSPMRGGSACKYSEACGGCQWIHIPYEHQLEWKRQFVQSALDRIGKLQSGFQVEIKAAPLPLAYRNRVHLKLQIDANQNLELGYYRGESRDLVGIDRCAIADDRLNHIIASLHQVPMPVVFAGTLKLELQVFPDEAAVSNGASVTATFFPERQQDDQRHAAQHLIAQLEQQALIRWTGFIMDAPANPFLHFERFKNLQLFSRPGLFQQVNLSHNQHMRDAVDAAIAAANPRRIMDVCCGSGNFSLGAADGQRYIEGIEANPGSIACAHHNIEANNLTGTKYICGDATKHLWRAARQGEKFDLIILDPPREGLYEGMIPLKKIGPQTIIYVSCDPSTLARDIGTLCKQDYRIESVVAYDFFPNTFHVESLVVLQRNS